MSAIFVVFFPPRLFSTGEKRLDPSFPSGCPQELIRLCVQAPLFRNKGTVTGDFMNFAESELWFDFFKAGNKNRVKKTTWKLPHLKLYRSFFPNLGIWIGNFNVHLVIFPKNPTHWARFHQMIVSTFHHLSSNLAPFWPSPSPSPGVRPSLQNRWALVFKRSKL